MIYIHISHTKMGTFSDERLLQIALILDKEMEEQVEKRKWKERERRGILTMDQNFLSENLSNLLLEVTSMTPQAFFKSLPTYLV